MTGYWPRSFLFFAKKDETSKKPSDTEAWSIKDVFMEKEQ